MWEIILKEPIKLLVASPIYQLEVLRIKTGELLNGNGKELDFISEEIKWIKISPDSVFTSQHSDWINFKESAIHLQQVYIPANNIAGVIGEKQNKK